MGCLLTIGCNDDLDTVRKIQAGRQARQQSETKVDHIGEAMGLVSKLVELDPTTAGRQIAYHLNAWENTRQAQEAQPSTKSKSGLDNFKATELLKTISDIIPEPEAIKSITQESFTPSDIEYIRYHYLLRQIVNWVLERGQTDPLWNEWLASNREALGSKNADALASAIKLFDWVTRNIVLEPLVATDPAPPAPAMPQGLSFRGTGYRQTPYQTLFRGTGDAWQRSTTFISLCRQASIDACMLGIADGAGNLEPWIVGVLIGEQLYLFDCALGMPVPGPGQVGIATLADARKDASVLRRLNVPGWFDYPVQKDDVQQCAALMVLDPESISLRFKRLQEGLTGDYRLVLYQDADATATSLEALTGIASARIWDVPVKARLYEAAIRRIGESNPMVAFYHYAPWTILEAEFEQPKRLSRARWKHLQGQFESDEDQAIEGAKPLYLSQRQPEFEIADLRIDVELQKQYGIRRDLGVTPEMYDKQIEQVQSIMRQGKNTATFWLSLIQYDSGRFDLAENWFEDRVLGDNQESRWEQAARYGLARAFEQLGNPTKAIELYKTEGDVQEHGNRIRARLLARSDDTDEVATDKDEEISSKDEATDAKKE